MAQGLRRSFRFSEEDLKRLYNLEDAVEKQLNKHVSLPEIIRSLTYWFDSDDMEGFAKFCELRKNKKLYENDFLKFLSAVSYEETMQLFETAEKKGIPAYETWAKAIAIASQ